MLISALTLALVSGASASPRHARIRGARQTSAPAPTVAVTRVGRSPRPSANKARPTHVLTRRQAKAKARRVLRAALEADTSTPQESTVGTDFWLAFESNCADSACDEGPGDLYVFISGDTATTGTITDPGISFSQTFSVTPGTVTSIQVPSDAEDDDVQGTDPDGIHVTAADPVSVYGLNTYPETTDGFLGLPTDILGTNYDAEGYEGLGGSQFAVLATQDNTTVTITPEESSGSFTAGVPYNVTLNAGQVYQYIASPATVDVSGTSVTSTEPVAVFAGNDCADVPSTALYCNTLAEEMTPTDTWGTSFLTEPLDTRSGDTFRFMASEANTTVDVNGTAVATLNAGQFYETILSAASQVTSNQPIQVMQYSNGETYDGADADPFDISIPPTAQFLSSYTVSTEPSGADAAITANYLNVTAPTSEVGSVLLDGSPIPSADFTAIGSSGFSGAEIPVAFGSHVLTGDLPFGVTVYGYGGYDGYGFPGGFTLSPIASVTTVSLSSLSGSAGQVGTQACFAATVSDQNGNPVAGVDVEFSVTGVNSQTGFAYTGTDGQAEFCYTGTNLGADSIQASVQTIMSPALSFTWTSDALTLTPASGSSPVGTSHSVTAMVTNTSTSAPVTGEPVVFQVAGANPQGPSTVSTNAQGQATFTYTGATAGSDSITACDDLNGNGSCDTGEPSGSATQQWTPSPASASTSSVIAAPAAATSTPATPAGLTIRTTYPKTSTLVDINLPTGATAREFYLYTVHGVSFGVDHSDKVLKQEILAYSGSTAMKYTITKLSRPHGRIHLVLASPVASPTFRFDRNVFEFTPAERRIIQKFDIKKTKVSLQVTTTTGTVYTVTFKALLGALVVVRFH